MFALERQKLILEELHKNGSVMVNELSATLGVTVETIRRDLEKLEKSEQLRRTHGGAVLYEETPLDLSLEKRSGLNIEGKIVIGKKAVAMVRQGDTIFLDSSTTSYYFSKFLKDFKNITIITNNLLIINELQACDKIKLIATGGTLDTKNLSFVGEIALRNIENNLCANKFFFSSKGIDPKQGIMESNDVEYQIKKAMLKNSKERICLADKSKFDGVACVKLANFSDIDCLVTDWDLPEKYKKALKISKTQYR